MSEVGMALRTARLPRTIAEVERDGKIPHATVSKVERGLLLPSLGTLVRLASFYNLTHMLGIWVAMLERDRIARQRERLHKEVL